MRTAILDRIHSFVSGLDVVQDHPLVADYPSRKFTSDPQALMADMKFESLIADVQ